MDIKQELFRINKERSFLIKQKYYPKKFVKKGLNHRRTINIRPEYLKRLKEIARNIYITTESPAEILRMIIRNGKDNREYTNEKIDFGRYSTRFTDYEVSIMRSKLNLFPDYIQGGFGYAYWLDKQIENFLKTY